MTSNDRNSFDRALVLINREFAGGRPIIHRRHHAFCEFTSPELGHRREIADPTTGNRTIRRPIGQAVWRFACCRRA
jgi:hypothetical protein